MLFAYHRIIMCTHVFITYLSNILSWNYRKNLVMMIEINFTIITVVDVISRGDWNKKIKYWYMTDTSEKSARRRRKNSKFEGTTLWRTKRSRVQKNKLKAQQDTRWVVFCDDKPLENVFSFKYLGSLFSANGLHIYLSIYLSNKQNENSLEIKLFH